MINLALLYTKQCRPISITAILDVFESVNNALTLKNLPPVFNIQVISNEPHMQVMHYGYDALSLKAGYTAQLILIPAFKADHANLQEAVTCNDSFVPWLVEQYNKGAEIASFCTGAFLLAATGLLNGRKATTHVLATYELAKNFPEINVQPEEVVTYDNRIYTSGGATNTFHLLLHLVEKYSNRATAVQIAKLFAIDMDRDKQNYFATFLPPKEHHDTMIAHIQERMENMYTQSLTIEEMIGDIPSSRRNFVRRFKYATGLTPIEYLQRTRLEGAKQLLERTNKTVAEVMYNSGYNDVKSFRQLFKRGVGLTPKEYREKFNPLKHN